MSELVSIVIPTYNRRKIISRAIDSCLNQTYKKIEIVICDDHSTDKTLEFIKSKYGEKENIICCLTPEGKKGANAARNEAIKKAKGKYIAFLDSDDYLTKNSIENRVKMLLDSQYALVYGNVYYKNGRNMSVGKFDDISKYQQRKYLMQELSLCITSSIMIKKSVIKKIGYLDEELRSWQDDDLVISTGLKYKIGYCNYPVAVIVASESSIFKNKENLYKGCKRIVEKYKKEIIRTTSRKRYWLWRIRIIASWVLYHEQKGKCVISRKIYQVIYCVIYKIIRRQFRHIYA